jgi:ABC-2 type transport system permease protein
MKKYLYGFKLYFLNAFNYRFNAVISLLFSGLGMLITLFFWFLIYGGDAQKTLNGFTFSGIVTYFFIGSVFRAYNYPGFMISGMIKSGSLGPALLKPHNLSLHIYFRNIANLITGMIPQALFVLCLLPLAAKYLTWNLNAFNAASLLLFFIVGTVSNYLVWSLFGYMAFWLEEAEAIMWSFAVLCNLITGMFIPLAFFPKWSVPVLEALPFSSWSYIPTKIYIGLYSVENQIFLFIVQITWIAVLLLLNKIVWNNGVKKFTSVGG